ncbi:YajQ family cyclic di-GMP-binding protein [Caldalkalibacillus mannanilyticus]|uniref:YajQ family cyclic di-GMP-binding protein n=1 Tax=Caldalkalibacillus mannanilyticus TaxID=1418 RepID=UPI00046A60E5|nr:YajQ family cyclic di-GMP-binding protein [Caldalkalibacillus mannanilyticus]
MSKESSFDIVSKLDLQEVDNAIRQAMKEIENRYDFKGSKSDIKLEKEQLVILSEDEYKLNSVVEILQSKLIKRNVPIKSMKFGKIEGASGGMVRQKIDLMQGIDQEGSKIIGKIIKDSKLKVKYQIQGDQLRVSGKSLDDLQKVMQLIRDADLSIAVQFVNYR